MCLLIFLPRKIHKSEFIAAGPGWGLGSSFSASMMVVFPWKEKLCPGLGGSSGRSAGDTDEPCFFSSKCRVFILKNVMAEV